MTSRSPTRILQLMGKGDQINNRDLSDCRLTYCRNYRYD